MGSKDAKAVVPLLTGGSKVVNDTAFAVSAAGETINLRALLEDGRQSRAVYIANLGAEPIYVAFDKNGGDIVTADGPKTTNPTSSWDVLLLAAGSDLNLFSSNIEASKIALRCGPALSSTAYILVG